MIFPIIIFLSKSPPVNHTWLAGYSPMVVTDDFPAMGDFPRVTIIYEALDIETTLTIDIYIYMYF